MTWTGQSFTLNQILTSTQMNNLQADITAQANGDSGAPKQQTAGIADSAVTTAKLNQTASSEAVTTACIRDSAVTEAKIGAGAVHQSELDTSMSAVSTDTNNTSDNPGNSVTQVTLPGGQYGFYPQSQSETTSTTPQCNIYYYASGVSANTTYATKAMLFNAATSTDRLVYMQQRYINSSPPYNLGDGDIPIFIFLNYSKIQNKVKGYYVADVPPWAYNGPTDITPTRKETVGGLRRKYKTVKQIDEDTGDIIVTEVEIDHAFKNSDMGIIPHPFIDDPDYEVILLDPVETLHLKDLNDMGESISTLIKYDYLRLDNTPINRHTPNGVLPSKFKWKNTVKRAGEAVQDRRLRRGPYAENIVTPGGDVSP